MSVNSVRPLCEDMARIAILELDETPKKLDEGIRHLKEWITKQPHLRARTDDQWLAAFLRGCKHSVERAKEKLDFYYTIRSVTPDLTALKFCDPHFEALLRAGIAKREKLTDPRVILFRISQYDPTICTPPDFFAVTLVLQQMAYMDDDPFVIAGCVVIFDFNGLNIGHLVQATPAYFKKFVFAGQDASPIRLKAAHLIGMPSSLEAIYNIGKRLLNEKNKKKIHMHRDFEELYMHVSKDILPKEYGGNGGSVEEINDIWVNKFNKYRPWLKEDLQYGTDETKRLGKSRTAELGLDGTFRQLDFD